jgi:hypothetical protein
MKQLAVWEFEVPAIVATRRSWQRQIQNHIRIKYLLVAYHELSEARRSR